MNLKLCIILAGTIAATGVWAATPKPRATRNNDKATPLVTQSADQLTAILTSNADRKAKADACRELAVVGTEKSLPALITLLADPEMNHMARYALETMPGNRVDAALREQLSKLKGLQLEGVISSLGVRKDAKAVKPLTALLGNSDAVVAGAAARALGAIGNSDALESLLAALAGKTGDVQLSIAEGSLKALEALGKKGSTKQVRAAYDRLRGMAALPVHVRVAATRGAILSAGKDTKLLREALLGSDLQFVAATRAALEMATPGAASTLVEVLPTLAVEKKTAVIQALGAMRAQGAVQPLSELARSGSPVRIAAIRALGQIGTAKVLPVLLDLSYSDQAEVAQASRGCVAGLTIPEAEQAVKKMLQSEKTNEQLLGIEMAARRRMLGVMPDLFRLAGASDASVKSAAFRRIGELGGPEQVPQLTSMVLKASAADVGAPAGALTRIVTQAEKTPTLRSQVVSAFDKAPAAQKVALLPAIQAVGGEEGLKAVRAALTDSNPEVNKAAQDALSDWTDMAAAPELLKLAGNAPQPSQRAAAFRGYIRLVRESDLAPGARLKMLREASGVDASPAGQKLVLSGLGDIASPASLKLVAEKLDDPALSEEASAAAVRIAEKLDGPAKAEAKPVIEKVVKTAKSASVLEKANKLLQ